MDEALVIFIADRTKVNDREVCELFAGVLKAIYSYNRKHHIAVKSIGNIVPTKYLGKIDWIIETLLNAGLIEEQGAHYESRKNRVYVLSQLATTKVIAPSVDSKMSVLEENKELTRPLLSFLMDKMSKREKHSIKYVRDYAKQMIKSLPTEWQAFHEKTKLDMKGFLGELAKGHFLDEKGGRYAFNLLMCKRIVPNK